MLGNGRLEAMCFDGVKRLCHIRGKLRKKVFIIASFYFIFVKHLFGYIITNFIELISLINLKNLIVSWLKTKKKNLSKTIKTKYTI